METKLLSGLDEFSDSLYQHLLSKGLHVQVQKSGDDIKHSYYDYSYLIQPISRVLVAIRFDDTLRAPTAFVAMTNRATGDLAEQIVQRYLEYTGVEETIDSVQADINTYLEDPANCAHGDEWFTYKQRSTTKYSFYFEAINEQYDSDNFIVNIASKDVSLLRMLLQYSHSHFYQYWIGGDHIKAALSIIYKASNDPEFNFKPKYLGIHSSAAMLGFDLDDEPRSIVITYGCRGLVFYTDLDTKETQTVVMGSNYKALVFEHYDIFKDFVTGKVKPDLIKKE